MRQPINVEELLKYEQEQAIAIWEAPLSTETLSALTKNKRAKDPEVGEDMGVGNNFNTDGTELPKLPSELQKFGTWLGVAATINRKAYQSALFDPATTSFDDMTWATYDSKFKSAPFWLSTNNKKRECQITELSLSPVIDAIANLIQGFVTPTGFDDIVTSVKKIAELAVNNRDQNQKDTYEQTGLITIHDSQLYVCNTRTQVSFTYYQGKGYQQLKQTLNIQTCVGMLDFDKCQRSADKIIAWDQTDVDDWATGTASNDKAPNGSPAWDR